LHVWYKRKTVGLESVDCINMTQHRDDWQAFVTTVMNLQFPWNAGNFLMSFETVSFSRRSVLHAFSQSLSYACVCARITYNKATKLQPTGCEVMISECPFQFSFELVDFFLTRLFV
jgi:hypothetical protein